MIIRNIIEKVSGKQRWYKTLSLSPEDKYIDFEINIDFTFEQGENYKYSKMYFNSNPNQSFHESRVICFQPIYRSQYEHIRLRLPEEVIESGYLSIRIDGLPYSKGSCHIRNLRTVIGNEDPRLTLDATWRHNRQQVREQVIESESFFPSILTHLPESLSLELTPRCNLHCPHCSSHGTPDVHDIHNKRSEMSPLLFERIAHELFPHITALSLVGRGEPTMVSNALWRKCDSLVRLYGVKVSCVTNGHFIKKRITEDFLPYVDELCISIDGNSAEVHAQNRGGSSLKKVIENIEYFHNLRLSAKLARRPRLSFYWTIMSNNIHELPEFIRAAEKYNPDYFAIRHLVVFREKDRHLSLLGEPEKTNAYLKEAYHELNSRGIRFEGPPLMDEQRAGASIPEAITVRETLGHEDKVDGFSVIDPDYLAEKCTWMCRTGIIGCNGEVTSCGKHYGEVVGSLDGEACFNDVWNGSAMQSLRSTFNTPNMWQQCRECWLRELRWHSQRYSEDGENNAVAQCTKYSSAAWDYRDYSDL